MKDDERGEMTTIERPGFSRRKLLTTAAVGVPAMGALGAVNLFGAPAARANPYVPIDGLWGSGTTAGLQEVLGTPVDGVVSGQNEEWAGPNTALTSGWEWVPAYDATGSTVISAMQSRIGVAADGLIGPETIRALARYLKWSDNSGVLVEPSQVVGSLQGRVQDGWF